VFRRIAASGLDDADAAVDDRISISRVRLREVHR
jgi:hypothetical protein